MMRVAWKFAIFEPVIHRPTTDLGATDRMMDRVDIWAQSWLGIKNEQRRRRIAAMDRECPGAG